MENTGKVLFEDDAPQWYLALGERWIGPLSAADVYQRVLAQEVTWAHFVWKAGQPDWKRICDVKTFQGAVPSLPVKSVQQEVKEASKPGIRTGGRGGSAAALKAASPGASAVPAPALTKRAERPVSEPRSWFLFYNDSQYGPFSNEEIRRFLLVGKIHGRVHIWRDGQSDWVRLETVTLFADEVEEARKVRDLRKSAGSAARSKEQLQAQQAAEKAEEKKDLRAAPRRPLIAKILVANQEAVTAAVCRDISVGGMQVLTDMIPGEAGQKIRMNVSPARASGKTAAGKTGVGKSAVGTGKEIEPFVAEGVIVRILEDGRGFSFRFEKLSDSSKRAIEAYIHAND